MSFPGSRRKKTEQSLHDNALQELQAPEDDRLQWLVDTVLAFFKEMELEEEPGSLTMYSTAADGTVTCRVAAPGVDGIRFVVSDLPGLRDAATSLVLGSGFLVNLDDEAPDGE